MLSKPLFKQSCKANLGIWSFVTIITSAILAVLIFVIGNLNVGTISNSMVDIFVEDSIEASIKKQSMTYFNLTEEALLNYDDRTNALDYLLNTAMTEEQKSGIIANYNGLIASGKTDAEAREALIPEGTPDQQRESIGTLLDYYLARKDEQGDIDYNKTNISAYILGLIEQAIYEQLVESDGEVSANYSRQFIHQAVTDYITASEVSSVGPTDFATFYIPNVLKALFVNQSINNNGKIIKVSDYFDETEIGDISLSAILSYKANLGVKEEQLREQIKTEHPDYSEQEIENEVALQMKEYKTETINNLSGSLLDKLPEDISVSLQELGNMDISELVIGSMFFKMAGILLPIVFIIMTANNLMASQVDSGSMAYVLSTPTKRKTVSLTQMAYLVTSLFAMFLCTMIVGLICLAIVGDAVSITYGQMALLSLGAFITMFAISGICFLASSWFNRSKLSMSIGGGLSMFFFVATILGLFGSSTVPSMMRIDAMKAFNYLSIISLFDTVSVLEGTVSFIWKLAILLVVGVTTYTLSLFKFKNKDLPL